PDSARRRSPTRPTSGSPGVSPRRSSARHRPASAARSSATRKQTPAPGLLSYACPSLPSRGYPSRFGEAPSFFAESSAPRPVPPSLGKSLLTQRSWGVSLSGRVVRGDEERGNGAVAVTGRGEEAESVRRARAGSRAEPGEDVRVSPGGVRPALQA